MGTVKTGSLLGVIAIAHGLSGGTAFAADNWMREYVQLRKQAMLERAIGIERAAELRARMLAQPKIVGGTKAGPNANPFQVGLLTKSISDNFRPNSAAALSSDRMSW